MFQLGEYINLKVKNKSKEGYVLENKDLETIVLPYKSSKKDYILEDRVSVFVYHDGQGNLIALDQKPKLTLNKYAYLKVIKVDTKGAYLDWGMPEGLFAPNEHQKELMEEGRSYVVYMDYDVYNKQLFASARVENYLDNTYVDLKEGEEVAVLVLNKSDLGYNLVVNNWYSGLVFFSDIFQELETGMRLKAYVKTIREDLKLDIVLQKQGFKSIEPNAQKIIDHLTENGGEMFLTDKSKPEDIYQALQMSKKIFKKALGLLYKKRLVDLKPDKTVLNK